MLSGILVAEENKSVTPNDESKPPVTSGGEMASSSQISRGRYVTGGVLSTVLGLGIGHAVQGRYLPLGLVFTVGEAASWAVFLVDRSSLKYDDNLGDYFEGAGTLGWIGVGVAGALHIWEVLDSWIVGNEYTKAKAQMSGAGISEKYTPQVTVLPVSGSGSVPGASLVMTF